MSEMNFETWVKELADAIRTKKGTSDKIKALDYKQEILSIETGASGEPIIIETEEDFNALLENATQEDDGKIYLYNDNLYKLNYNETTTSRTLEIVANGEYDVALYDKVNVQVQSESSGATIEVLGATPIPNDGTFVESVMFNTSLSDDEVKSILDGLTYSFNEMAGVDVHIIYNSASGTGSLIVILKPAEDMYALLDYTTTTVFWHNIPDMTADLGAMGWGQFTNPYPTNDNAMSGEFYGSPVGAENDKLKSLVYIQGEPTTKTLSGTYDGSSIDIIENGVVDVEMLIDEGKIPLKINVDVESGAKVEYLGGTALPTNGTISKIYFNVNRNPKDLLKIAKTLTYDYAVGSMGNAFPMVKSSSGDGLGILKLEKSEGTYYILARLSDVKMFWFGIGEQAQWGDGTSNSMVSEFELNWEIVQGGENNDLLKDFVSTTPFDQVNIQKISGTLDGRPITIVENAPIFMDNYIRENKLPMQINVDVKFGDFVPYDNNEIKNVFINTSLTNEEVDYELSKLNYSYYNINFYVFVGDEKQNGITIYEEDTTKHQIVFSKYNSNTSKYEKIIIYDTINGNGWVEETISTYFPNNVIELPTTSPIGSQNNLIKKVISAVLEVDENGTYDTTKYGATIVNVASSGEDMLQTRVDLTNSCAYLMYQFKGSNVDFISNLNTSNVTDMSYMFAKCMDLPTIPQLDTSKVTNMERMFDECRKLTTIPLLNTSEVTKMHYMFYTCEKLTILPQLDTSKVTTMYYMFGYCSILNTIPQLNTSNVTNMGNMFYRCTKLPTIPPLDTSKVTNMSDMFNNCSILNTIPQLNTSKVTNMGNMFYNCSNLTTISLLDMRSITYGSYIFYNCTNLTNLTLKNIKLNLQIGSGTSWGHLLTLESLLNTCQECINVNASRTLTMGSANLEKLASVYVKLTGEAEEDATLPKLPMVQCESSDEGAMTIQDYMAMKNWTLA